MRNLIIGIIIGMLVSAPVVWAWSRDIRISDADGTVADITSSGQLSVSF